MKLELMKTSAIATGVALAFASLSAQAATQPSLTTAGASSSASFTGGATVIIWESLSGGLFELYSLVPGFALSLTAIAAVSWISVKPNAVVQKQFDQMRIQL